MNAAWISASRSAMPSRTSSTKSRPDPAMPAPELRPDPALLQLFADLGLVRLTAPVGGGLAHAVTERGDLHQRVGRGGADHRGQVRNVGADVRHVFGDGVDPGELHVDAVERRVHLL